MARPIPALRPLRVRAVRRPPKKTTQKNRFPKSIFTRAWALEAETESRLKQMESDLGEQLAIVQTSEQQLKVYDEGLIPQSEAALNAGLAGYRAGKQEYQGLLASFADTLQLSIDRERTLAEHEAAVSRIEGLIGEELQ